MIYVRNDAVGIMFCLPEIKSHIENEVLLDILTKTAGFMEQVKHEIPDALTRAYIEKRGQAYLNLCVGSCVIHDGKIVCDASNNPPSVLAVNQVAATLNFRRPSGELYFFTLFLTKE